MLRLTIGVAASSSAALVGIELELAGIENDVGAPELAELGELGGCPCRLHGPATAEDDDLADAGGDDRLDRRIGRVGGSQLLSRQREHARDVERDVPVPDDDCGLTGEVELQVLEVRVAVVPGNELRRGPRPGKVLAGDPEAPVRLRADRVEDGVVRVHELVVRHRLADLDVPEEAEPGPLGDALERA